MTDGAAATALRADGFSVRMGAAVTDNNARAGTVARTVPAVGGRVHKRSAITIIPSAGPRMIKVPDVSGQPLAGAQQALRNAGLTPGQVRKVASGSVDAGIVVSTQPAAGLSSPQQAPIAITVSEGAPLPDFRGQDQQSIQQWASQNGITLNVQQDTGSSQPQGIITRQSPAPGTPITVNETVTIGVSAGPPQVAIPNVDGISIGEARQKLMKRGFDVTVNRFGPFNKVFAYSPHDQAPKGSTITIDAGFCRQARARGKRFAAVRRRWLTSSGSHSSGSDVSCRGGRLPGAFPYSQAVIGAPADAAGRHDRPVPGTGPTVAAGPVPGAQGQTCTPGPP